MRHSLIKLSPIVIGIAAMIACGSDSTPPPPPLVGSYNAFAFTMTGSSGQTNQLLIGSTVTINLASNGSTTGHLHLAASGGSPAFDADLAGTWTQTGNSVTFSQAADTFVRNMTFAVVAASGTAWDLVGTGTFSGTAVQLTLRQVVP